VRKIPFLIREDCMPEFQGELSACLVDPLKRRCTPTAICFNRETCGARLERRACLLLIEIVNWCGCKYHNQKDESRVPPVLRACGVAQLCRPGT
jgi:hypothetical protein